MPVLQLTADERVTLDRLTDEVRGEALKAKSAGRQALRARLAADYRLVDGYVRIIYQEMAKLGVAPACRAGCDYCCYMTVHVAEAEAFQVAEAIEATEDAAALRASVLAAAPVIRGMTDADRYARQIPCALLDRRTGRCRVYESRPFVCRTHNSTSRLGCRKAFRAGSPTAAGDRVGGIRKAIVLGGVARQGYVEGTAAAGFASRGVELTQALAVIFSTENAYERWAAGEDIFAALRSVARPAAPAEA